MVADQHGRFRFSPRYFTAHSIKLLGWWDQSEEIVLEPVMPGSTTARVVSAGQESGLSK